MFAAGIVYSGVPAGCFFTGTENGNPPFLPMTPSTQTLTAAIPGWNNTCSQGQVTSTPERWAQWVFDAYPDYDGPRPRMQIYHGSADTTLAAPNYAETIKQWCGVFGCDPDAPDESQAGVPEGAYTTETFAEGKLVGVYGQGVGHSVPIHGDEDMAFFGL